MSIITTNREKMLAYLRDIYTSCGYAQYRMRKFEEYDLYVRNKSFLTSDHMITFTDREGRLLALKPDVTLSIVKNTRENAGVEKVYYHESVYREEKGSNSFNEITQIGLECIGEVDDYAVLEVLSLAQESLAIVSAVDVISSVDKGMTPTYSDYVLDVSHLGILSDLLSGAALPDDARAALITCIGEKNAHGILSLCRERGVDEERTAALCRLCTLYGAADEVLPTLDAMPLGATGKEALATLSRILGAMEKDVRSHVRVDFSVVNDMNYYSGIVFRGFVSGVPAGVLSGGQYDHLLERMGKRGGAIGFAVYPDLLYGGEDTRPAYDVDALVLYDDKTDLAALAAAVKGLNTKGKRVLAARALPEKKTWQECYRISEGGELVHA